MPTKKLIVLAVFALAAGTVGSQACDYGRQADNATPVVVATEQPIAQQPAAEHAPVQPKVTTEEPTPAPAIVADCSGANC
jgi:hypothetical protein